MPPSIATALKQECSKEPPPCPELVAIDPNGSLYCRSENEETLLGFDEWLLHRACEHENGVLRAHYIGNMTLVGLLRSELERQADMYPVSLAKILYSGTHTGDYLRWFCWCECET